MVTPVLVSADDDDDDDNPDEATAATAAAAAAAMELLAMVVLPVGFKNSSRQSPSWTAPGAAT